MEAASSPTATMTQWQHRYLSEDRVGCAVDIRTNPVATLTLQLQLNPKAALYAAESHS